MDVKALIARYPRLYHMAEKNAWRDIKTKGLLSTSAVLDRYSVKGARRIAIEEKHRSEKVSIGEPGDQVVLRDQKPMEPSRLAQALQDGITPTQWYKLLNNRVFLWAEETRLFGLLNARYYRALEHDVLTIDTASLMSVYEQTTWLCPMNSGNTFPIPHFRGKSTFQRIAGYPTKVRSQAPAKEVVEVVVDYSIPDIAKHVVEVRRIKGTAVLGNRHL